MNKDKDRDAARIKACSEFLNSHLYRTLSYEVAAKDGFDYAWNARGEYDAAQRQAEAIAVPTETLNMIYEQTGGASGPDPDAYGRAVEAEYQRLNAKPTAEPVDVCECGHVKADHNFLWGSMELLRCRPCMDDPNVRMGCVKFTPAQPSPDVPDRGQIDRAETK